MLARRLQSRGSVRLTQRATYSIDDDVDDAATGTVREDAKATEHDATGTVSEQRLVFESGRTCCLFVLQACWKVNSLLRSNMTTAY